MNVAIKKLPSLYISFFSGAVNGLISLFENLSVIIFSSGYVESMLMPAMSVFYVVSMISQFAFGYLGAALVCALINLRLNYSQGIPLRLEKYVGHDAENSIKT